MAFSERKYLNSIELLLTAKTINVQWIEEVLKNGVVISSQNHRGSYPLNDDGEPDDEVQTLIGSTLKDILGEAGTEAQKKVDDLTTQLQQRDLTIQQYADSVNELNHQISLALEDRAQRIADTHALNQELATRQATIDGLNFKVGELNTTIQNLSTNLSDRDEKIRGLEAELDKVREQLTEAKNDWEFSQDELASVKAELDEVNKVAGVLKTELDGVAKAQVDENAGTE